VSKAARARRYRASRSHNCEMPRSAPQYRHRRKYRDVLDRFLHRFCCLSRYRDLQRSSSTIGVSAQRSLPVFRPRSGKHSGALRRSGATGTNFGDLLHTHAREAPAENHCRGNAAIRPYPAQTQEREGIKGVVVPRR
jgi:hypothetical protein